MNIFKKMDSLQGMCRPETYTIGFTENQYNSMDDEYLSPSPTDHLLGYNSSALDYAERTNKGEENIFLGRSITIDKERYRSVGKINNGILEIVFELTERRKTPFPNRTRKEELTRCDSELSNCSSVSFKSSSSSVPTDQSQHASPREQRGILPSISHNTQTVSDKKKEAKKKRKKSNIDNSDKQNSENDNLPKLKGVVNKVIEQNKAIKEEEQRFTADQKQTHVGSSSEDTTDKTGFNSTGVGKWQYITEKIVEANKLVREGRMDLDKYKGRYLSPEYNQTRRRLSFCQSSYSERRERERINNIRRRHVSQVTTGPLDFNKLRRQITVDRSNSFVR